MNVDDGSQEPRTFFIRVTNGTYDFDLVYPYPSRWFMHNIMETAKEQLDARGITEQSYTQLTRDEFIDYVQAMDESIRKKMFERARATATLPTILSTKEDDSMPYVIKSSSCTIS